MSGTRENPVDLTGDHQTPDIFGRFPGPEALSRQFRQHRRSGALMLLHSRGKEFFRKEFTQLTSSDPSRDVVMCNHCHHHYDLYNFESGKIAECLAGRCKKHVPIVKHPLKSSASSVAPLRLRLTGAHLLEDSYSDDDM